MSPKDTAKERITKTIESHASKQIKNVSRSGVKLNQNSEAVLSAILKSSKEDGNIVSSHVDTFRRQMYVDNTNIIVGFPVEDEEHPDNCLTSNSCNQSKSLWLLFSINLFVGLFCREEQEDRSGRSVSPASQA